MRISSSLTLCLVAPLAVATSAQAELAYGVTDASAQQLVFFDTAAPAALSNVGNITGLASGQVIRATDFRASDGQFYAVTTSTTDATAAQLWTINLGTGAATAIGAGFTLTGNTSTRISIDFNPVPNALRVVTGSAQSYRINAGTGAVIAQDTSIAGTPLISGVAYTNNVVGAATTTLYAYNFLTDQLATIGGIGGAPSPNGGTFNIIGGSGVVTGNAGGGLDISGATGDAFYAGDTTADTDSNSEFFRVNLATGAFTLIGAFNVALIDFSIRTVAAVPAPASLALALAALGLMTLTTARRRRA